MHSNITSDSSSPLAVPLLLFLSFAHVLSRDVRRTLRS
jgi:hypothetical protein